MKFTKALLASALAAQVSAQCSIKSGQIAVIGPLADAWKLYNKQVAINAEIDAKIAAAESASAATAESIEAHHAGQATAAEGVHAGVVADIGTSHGTTVAAIGTKLTETQNSIEAKYQEALTAAQQKHDARQANADANIANLQARGTAAGTTSDEAKASASADAAGKREAAQAKADQVKADIAAEAAAGVTFTDARDVAARAKINAKHAASVLSLAQRYVEIHDKIEGTKFDVDATLAVLDNAGQEGGTPYDNACFVQVSDAIGMVKAEMTPGEIWEQVVINGNAQARQAVTDEPTNAPTDAPTDAPTYRDLTDLEQCLVDNGVRTLAQAAVYGADEARNTFIEYESNRSEWTVSGLQALDNAALLAVCDGTSRLTAPGSSFRADLCDEITVTGAGYADSNGVYRRVDDVNDHSQWCMGDVLPNRDCSRGKIWFETTATTQWGWGVSNYHHHRYYNGQIGNLITAFDINRNSNYAPANAATPLPVLQCTNYRYFDEGNPEPVAECKAALSDAYAVDNYDKNGLPDSNLIDGNWGTFAHTEGGGWDWARVKVNHNVPINRVVTVNRQDCCRDRLKDFQIWVGPTASIPNGAGNQAVATENANGASTITSHFSPVQGPYLFVWKHNGDANILNLGEIEAYYAC